MELEIIGISSSVKTEILRQMFHNYANSATNAGNYPANVPKNSQNSNKCRRLSGKCSTITQIQQQTPGIFRQMLQKTTKTTTNAGEKTPANVPKNHQNARALCARYETRVGSPPDFQLKRASAPSCLRALNRSTQAGRRANTGK